MSELYESESEQYWEVSTANSSTAPSLSEYSEQPSETAVDVIEAIASTLSLMTCGTSISEYSMPPSEADVSFSQLNDESLFNEEDGLGLVYSEYSLPPAETDVEMETCAMLYPQSYIPYLFAPERAECDTPAPPSMMLYPQSYIPSLSAPERAECDTPAPPSMIAAN